MLPKLCSWCWSISGLPAGLGSNPGRGHCVLFSGKILYSHSVSQTSCYGSWEKLRPDGPLVWEWDVLRWLKDKWNYVVGKEEIWNYLNDFSRSYNRSSFPSLRNEDNARSSLIFRELSFFPLSFALVISLLIFVILRGWETFLDIDILMFWIEKMLFIHQIVNRWSANVD